MAIIQSNIEVHGILDKAIKYIKSNPEVIDEIFYYFKADHLADIYGDKMIRDIKEWFLTEDVVALMPWAFNETQVPCFVVHLRGPTTEDTNTGAYLGDFGGLKAVPSQQDPVVPTFVPQAYSEDGMVVVPSNVSLEDVWAGYKALDGSGTIHTIVAPFDDNSFFIEAEAAVDPSSFTIYDPNDIEVYEMGSVHNWDTIEIIMLAQGDQSRVMWLSSILQYIMLKFKPSFIARDLSLTTFNLGEPYKVEDFMGENVFGREMSFRVRTQSTWRMDKLDNILTVDLTTSFDSASMKDSE